LNINCERYSITNYGLCLTSHMQDLDIAI